METGQCKLTLTQHASSVKVSYLLNLTRSSGMGALFCCREWVNWLWVPLQRMGKIAVGACTREWVNWLSELLVENG